jgi:hypothetical protein
MSRLIVQVLQKENGTFIIFLPFLVDLMFNKFPDTDVRPKANNQLINQCNLKSGKKL